MFVDGIACRMSHQTMARPATVANRLVAALQSGEGDPCEVVVLFPVIRYPVLRSAELGVKGFTTEAKLHYIRDWAANDVIQITIREADGAKVASAMIRRWSDRRWGVHYHLDDLSWEWQRISGPASTPR